MPTLNFEQARECVLRQVQGCAPSIRETVPLAECAGRVLAEEVTADRDYPPLTRSVRDGFAVHAGDFPGSAQLVGEVRAGNVYTREVRRGECVEIMTGAPLPAGADAVIMIEHTRREGELIFSERAPEPGEFLNPKGSECLAGAAVLSAGQRIGFAHVAMLATVGQAEVAVWKRPRVAILATGDEIVEGGAVLDHQIRNSNAYSLAVQVRSAGGLPQMLPVARDEVGATRDLIERGLEADLLLLSGGVSAGKYDIVEKVLSDLGAEFFFDRVLIQPGQPLVFGKARGKWFFGLPGNPASTMVTFELFAKAAVQLLTGEKEPGLPLVYARLTEPFRHKPGLTRFLPASLSADGSRLTPVRWQGSSDVAALARANAFLVAEHDRESWNGGELMRVLVK
ncbi:MAG TPA: gephyrin-like molybdotransferase Glp [Bryobacteraceae bacterium]|nr:gephyrin-like molybdotransferase Glp [Bryobacteraceae bacterium]